MEKRLTAKTKLWINDFKSGIAEHIQAIKMDNTAKTTLLEYVYEYPHLIFSKEDIQKRTRVKNTVPYHERCRALRANGEQCTRRKKDDHKFCGTHIKGIPHGEISEEPKNVEKFKKIQVWAEEINGIIRHLDKSGNVYDPQDIYRNTNNPKIIAKWELRAGKYCLKR